MALEPKDVITLVQDHIQPKFNDERQRLLRIDKWARWNHDRPFTPARASQEYKELAERAEAPWGDLVVSTFVQTLLAAGYRQASAETDSTAWSIWQANGLNKRQIPLHRASLTYGIAYNLVLPGKTLTGAPMPTVRGCSPREMIAMYDDVAADDWPTVAMRVTPLKNQRARILVIDDTNVHTLESDGFPIGKLTYIGEPAAHGAGVCPVVRFCNRFDLEGRSAGEIEPYISVLGSIDQTTFDRLIVQRFGAWIVRTISGLSVADSAAATGKTTDQVRLELSLQDFLTAEDSETKFGSIPATPMGPFVDARESDIKVLAAVSQTPAHEMLGNISNLSAEALAAADASKAAKSDLMKTSFGEDHAQTLRLGAFLMGDEDGANDFAAQIRWHDTSIRSLAQAVDAYGKMAAMLGYPPELLWSKVPGFDDLDVEQAKAIVEQGNQLDAEIHHIIEQMKSVAPEPPGPPPPA